MEFLQPQPRQINPNDFVVDNFVVQIKTQAAASLHTLNLPRIAM